MLVEIIPRSLSREMKIKNVGIESQVSVCKKNSRLNSLP